MTVMMVVVLRHGRKPSRQDPPGSVASHVRFLPTLAPAGDLHLRGVVRDSNGDPVAGAWIAISSEDVPLDDTRMDVERARVVRSDDDGDFEVDGLGRGRWTLTATSGDRSAIRHGVDSDADRVELVLGSASGGKVSGRITNIRGEPVADAEVALTGFTSTRDTFVTHTDGEGRYQTVLPFGIHLLEARAPGYAPGRGGADVTDVPAMFDVELVPASTAEGRVLDGAKRPVSGARVSAIELCSMSECPVRKTVSGESGRFVFDDLEPGQWVLLARTEELAGLTSPAIDIGLGSDAHDLQVVLQPAVHVNGHVTSDDGLPVRSARVELSPFDAMPLSPDHDLLVEALTGPDGTYRLDGIFPGKYGMAVLADGFRRGQAMLRVGQADSEHDVTLTRLSFLSGKVVDPSGRPVEGATVESDNDESSRTDRDGHWKMSGRPARQIAAWKTGVGFGSRLASVSSAEQDIVLTPGRRVTGTVRFADGAPAPGARVDVDVPDGPAMSEMAHVGTDGRFVLDPLPAAKLSISVVGPVSSFGFGAVRTRAADLRTTESVHLEFSLPRGDLTIEGAVQSADGVGVPGARIRAETFMPGGGDAYSSGDSIAFSERDGHFVLRGLVADIYRLRVEHPDFAIALVVPVDAGATGITVALQSKSAIGGRVVDGSGGAIPDYVVKAKLQAGWERDLERTLTVHDPSGGFLFDGLPEGTYGLTVSAADGRVGSTTVRIHAGERRVDLVVVTEKGVSITGRLAEFESDAPIGGAEILLTAAGEIHSEEVTGPDGFFSVGPVPPGTEVMAFVTGRSGSRERWKFLMPTSEGDVFDAGTLRVLRSEAASAANIGLTVTSMNGSVSVSAVRPGSPADGAVPVGSEIEAIDGRPIDGLGEIGTTQLLGGAPGSGVQLDIVTPSEARRSVTLRRVDSPKP